MTAKDRRALVLKLIHATRNNIQSIKREKDTFTLALRRHGLCLNIHQTTKGLWPTFTSHNND